MNTITTAWRLRDQIAKTAINLKTADPSITTEEAYEKAEELSLIELKDVLRLKNKIDDLMFETKGNLKQTYFITIRPDTKKIKFRDFVDLCNNFFYRRCFNTYLYSYEQKGTSIETLGEGFHIHIIAEMTYRSKGEVLRNTQSTFKKCTANNCIDVSVVKTKQDFEDIKKPSRTSV